MRAWVGVVALVLGLLIGEPQRVGWSVSLGALALVVLTTLRWRQPLWLGGALVGVARAARGLAEPSPPPHPAHAVLAIVWPEPMGEDCHLATDGDVLIVGPSVLCDTLLPGDRVRLATAARAADRFALAGEASELDRLHWRDARLRTRVLSPGEVIEEPEATLSLLRPLAWWRRAARRHFDAALPEAEAGLLRALVLGERQSVSPVDEGDLQRLGALHVVSVSGLHLGLVALAASALVAALLRRRPRLLLVRPLQTWVALVAWPVVLAYALMTGLAAPTLRGLVGVTLVGLALVLRRAIDGASILAATVGLLLLDEPSRLYDVSLQLSVAATLGLLWGAARARAPLRLLDRPLLRWLRTGLWLSFGSLLFTLPLCGWHFGELAYVAPLGNLLVVPLFEVFLLPLGLLVALLASLAPGASALAWATGLLREGTVFTRAFVEVAAARMPPPLVAGALVSALLAVLGLGAVHLTRWRGRLLAVSGMIVGALVLSARTPRLVATFLSVGHGDACLVETPDGQRLLIDGGGSLEPRLDPGRRTLLPFLRRRRIDRLQQILISHPHLDHVGGLVAVAEQLTIEELVLAIDDGEPPTLPALARLLAVARERRIPVRRPHGEPFGETALRVLHPITDTGQVGWDGGRSTNDNSVVARLGWRRDAVLLVGDLESEGEAELCDRRSEEARSTVLKIPHHGSSTSSSERLLACVRPSLAVLSGGRRNRFGLPKPAVLARYAAHAIPIVRTDLEGHLRVALDGGGGIEVRRVR